MKARRKKTELIPVNDFGGMDDSGVSIDKMVLSDIANVEGLGHSERHDRHTFHFLETGTMTFEIDFQTYYLIAPALIYMHPNQVHRLLTFDMVSVSSWAINNENLNPEYLNLLEKITPTKPLLLTRDTVSLLTEAVALCLKFSERKAGKLSYSVLRDGCNALVALVVSTYLESSTTTDNLSRFDLVTKAFKQALDHHFITTKRPAEYAQQLAISTPYLNECVKNATGFSVSHHIQQRIILEAKRLLIHSNQSVKEIATALGYEDYPYFSRLFTKVTGMSALTFRTKNVD